MAKGSPTQAPPAKPAPQPPARPAPPVPAPAPVEEVEPQVSTEPLPLFFAVVDDVDHSAVTAVIAVIPVNYGSDFVVYERRDGVWVEAPQFKSAIQSVDPPALVELTGDDVVDVVSQVDASDAAG